MVGAVTLIKHTLCKFLHKEDFHRSTQVGCPRQQCATKRPTFPSEKRKFNKRDCIRSYAVDRINGALTLIARVKV